ncbi:PAS domain-containing protein, partial [Streptomyces sp. NPDC052644]
MTIRVLVDVILSCPVPMALHYGDDFVLLYNQAYAEVIGDRHPDAMGRPAPEVYADLWHAPGVGEVIERAYRHGESFLQKESVLPVHQQGTGEHTVFTRGHSPVRDSTGRIVGVLTVAAQTSQLTQQLQSLSDFAAALSGTLTLDDVARVTLRYALHSFDADQVSFAVDDGPAWRLVRRIRGELLDEADERLPPRWCPVGPVATAG